MDELYDIELMDNMGRGYHNAYDFAQRFGVEPEEVIYALNNGTTVGAVNTNVYRYGDRRLFSENLGRLLKPGEHLPASKWEIRNVDTGIYYKDGADAARKIGCARSMVSMCLAGKRKTCKGFRLERTVSKGDNWQKV